MFVYSVKAQNLKLICSLAASVLVIVLVVFLSPESAPLPAALEAGAAFAEKDLSGIDTNEKRVALLEQYGVKVEAEPKEIGAVTIPAVWNELFEAYNQMQKKQGLDDLSSLKGKSVDRYSYVVTDFDYDGTVLADLLIWKEKVVAFDLRSAEKGGFLQGLTKDNALGV